MIPEVVVQRGIRLEAAGAAPGWKDQGGVEHGRDHVEFAALDRGRVGEDLERRPGLAWRVRHVDPAARPVVVIAANHGEDFAGLGIHADQRGVVEVVVIALLRDLVSHHLLRHQLQVEIERGVDAIPAPVPRLDVILQPQRLQHVVDEVGGQEMIGGRIDLQLRRVGRIRLFLGDEVVLDHCREHGELALLRGRQVDERVVLRGRLRQPGEHARLGEGQVVRIGLKIAVGGGLDAIGLAAIEDGVQVVAIEGERQGRFFRLALERVVRVRSDEELLDELLADRAAALLDAAVRVVGERRPHDGTEVDAAVRVEGMVLDGDRGIDHVGRDVAEGNDDAVIALVADVGKQVTAPVVDQHVLRQAGGGKPNDGGEIADRLRRDRRHRHQGQRHRGEVDR